MLMTNQDAFTRSVVVRAVNGIARWVAECKPWVIWSMVFLAGCLLYGSTAQTSASWQDSGTFQWRILTGDYVGILGLITAHPLLIWLGQLIEKVPLGGLLWRLNFLSGVGMSFALANFTILVMSLIRDRGIAILITAMLALSHCMWWIATITETYGWVSAGIVLEIYLLVKLIRTPHWSYVVLVALVNGITWSFHDFATLTFPVDVGVAVYLIWNKRLPAWSLLPAIVAYTAGAGFIITLIIRLAIDSGSLGTAISSVLFGTSQGTVLNTSFITPYTVPNMAIASLSFVNTIAPLAILGWMRLREQAGKEVSFLLATITIIEFVFWVRYGSEDQFTCLPPTLIMVALAAAVGADSLARRSMRWKQTVLWLGVASLVCMPLVYGLLPGVLRSYGVRVVRTRMLPFRDEMRYWITPWKQDENSAQMFADTALREAAPEGIILGDGTVVPALMVTRRTDPNLQQAQVEFQGSPLPSYDNDPGRFRRILGNRRLFVVSPIHGYLAGNEQILKDATLTKDQDGVLYRTSWLGGADRTGGQ